MKNLRYEHIYSTGLALSCLALSILFAKPYLYYANWDIKNAYGPWLKYIRENGGFSALSDKFSNYTPPYSYVLALADQINTSVDDVVIIKFVNIPFMLLSSFCTFCIVKHFTGRVFYSGIAAGFLFFLPNVGLNAYVWGQADNFYAAFILLSILFLLKERPYWAIAAFGFSVAIKLQGVFLAPFILFMILGGRCPWRALVFVPLAYFVAIAPAAIIGRPIVDLLLIYAEQGSRWDSLSMSAANPYYLLQYFTGRGLGGGRAYLYGTIFGIVAAALTGLAVSLSAVGRRVISDDLILKVAALSLFIMPFVLPKMHDRFFFTGEILLYILAWTDRRFIILAVAAQISAVLAYTKAVFPNFAEFSSEAVMFAALLNSLLLLYFLNVMRQQMMPIWNFKAKQKEIAVSGQ